MKTGGQFLPIRRGSALVEFAIVALVLYLLLAVIIEFGRMMYSAQALQQAADLGARELAKMPLPPTATFEEALADPTVKARIYDPNWLVIDLATVPDGDMDAYFAGAPIINQQLRPLYILDTQTDPTKRYLRYPGRMVASGSGFIVDVPIVNSDDSIDYRDVVEEIKPAGSDPYSSRTGPFSLIAPAPNPVELRGFVALRINYPFQAASMTGFHNNPNDVAGQPPNPNIGYPVEANEPDAPFGTYTGANGLGKQAAFAKEVRPFRRVISAQAIYRRELFAPAPSP